MNRIPKFKQCFICFNNTLNQPEKLFLSVPRGKRRKMWSKALKKNAGKNTYLDHHSTTVLYCCEDHFDLENDSENWMQFKMIQEKIILKPNVVPHIFHPKPSQLSPETRKRKLENINKFKSEKPKQQKIFPENEPKEEETQNDSILKTEYNSRISSNENEINIDEGSFKLLNPSENIEESDPLSLENFDPTQIKEEPIDEQHSISDDKFDENVKLEIIKIENISE